MYCSNCGLRNEIDSKFCYGCGKKINDLKKNKNSGNEETSLVLGIICLVSSFIVNIFCFIPGIISIVYAYKLKKENGKLGIGFGLSLAGMIFSICILILLILLIIFILNMSGNIPNVINSNELEFTNTLISL